jgi:hypothetical protein
MNKQPAKLSMLKQIFPQFTNWGNSDAPKVGHAVELIPEATGFLSADRLHVATFDRYADHWLPLFLVYTYDDFHADVEEAKSRVASRNVSNFESALSQVQQGRDGALYTVEGHAVFVDLDDEVPMIYFAGCKYVLNNDGYAEDLPE